MALRACRFIQLSLRKRNAMAERNLCSQSAEEVTFPMPFGHLAGRAWGPPDGRPVLCLHGYLDNLGTWEPLVPHLDPSLRLVSLDFPGHGLSSHLPAGASYQYMEMLLCVRLAVRHLGWTGHSLLGHSMGGGVCQMYASVFPDDVESVVSLDMLKPLTTERKNLLRETAASIDSALKIFEKNGRVVPLGHQEALGRVVAGSQGSLTTDTAEIIMKRGCRPVDGGLVFTRDLRLHVAGVQKLTHETCLAYLDRLSCHLMIVKAVPGLVLESADAVRHLHDMYTRNCSSYVYREVEGKHHFHMDRPQVVAELINPFLLGRHSKL